jgi:Tol biopolymer transport system component
MNIKLLGLSLTFAVLMSFGVDARAIGKKPASRYTPIKLSSGVKTFHGAVSWSPDGGKVAFIRKGVVIYDKKHGRKSTVRLSAPYYLKWTNDGLFALYRKGGRSAIAHIDDERLETKTVSLDVDAWALSGTMGRKNLLVLSHGFKELSIGTRVSYGLYVYDLKTGELKERYGTRRIIYGRDADARRMKGWASAGASPVETEAVFMEYHNPPALDPYVRIRVVDYLTGKVRDAATTELLGLTAFADWSPDGRKMALASDEGGLWMLELNGTLTAVDEELKGAYPSWNPMGSQIFIGGYVVDSDGKNKEKIIHGVPESIGQWSPDGKSMALIADKKLWLLEGFSPYFVPPDRKYGEEFKIKAWTLKGLLLEGFITEDEYRTRYNKLLENAEDIND